VAGVYCSKAVVAFSLFHMWFEFCITAEMSAGSLLKIASLFRYWVDAD